RLGAGLARGAGSGMRVAENVSALELDEYQHAARQVLRHPLITVSYPDKTTLPLVRKWAPQLRADLAETLGYTLVSSGDTIRLGQRPRTGRGALRHRPGDHRGGLRPEPRYPAPELGD